MKKTLILWCLSFFVSVAFFIASGAIIYNFSASYTPDPTQLTKQKEIYDYLEENWHINKYVKDPDILVPTGLFVKSLYFISSYNVHISGFVWQKYDKNSMHIENKNIIFPEGVEIKLVETYRRMVDDVLTIGWHFEGQFIQNFDYFDFPMDNKVAWLRMWHADFDKNVILTPDLSAYDSTISTKKFGIDPEIVLSGYTILETFFNYKKSNYDTNFGVKNYIGEKGFPELYYNVVLKRNMVNSAIVYFLPIMTAIIMMFFSVLLMTIVSGRLIFLGYNLMNLLTLAAFLLFVVVLSHTQLRSQVTSEKIMYLEYIYMIVYGAIVYIIIVAFLIDKSGKHPNSKIAAHDGLWVKLTFLPLVALSSFLATYFSF